jgi:hypothetical protein
MIRSFAGALVALPVLASCATFEPEPCTAKWFDWKTEHILGQFVYDHRKQIDDLRNVAPTMFGPEGGLEKIAPTSLIVLTTIGALQLTVDFAGQTWPEIDHAIDQCATAPRASRFFGDMLRREGVDERAVRAVEDLGNLMDS